MRTAEGGVSWTSDAVAVATPAGLAVPGSSVTSEFVSSAQIYRRMTQSPGSPRSEGEALPESRTVGALLRTKTNGCFMDTGHQMKPSVAPCAA